MPVRQRVEAERRHERSVVGRPEAGRHQPIARVGADDGLRQRLDPGTDGRPDPRPDVRENLSVLGNLASDFNFNQAPRRAVILPVHPATTLTGTPGRATGLDPAVAAAEG